jgi:serine protease Do
MKRSQLGIVIIIAFLVGTIGSIFFNRVIFPNLATVKGFAWVGKLQSSAPIVISRREEVRLNEGVNLIELTKQAQTVVVSIHAPNTHKFLGNGLIITSDGTIFTTKEVVGTNSQVNVITQNGNVYPALVTALDPKSPLAILRISASNLTVAQFSDAGNMQIAQRIFALGRTNLEFTREFSSGLVTKSLSNNIDTEKILSTEVFENTIKTDAALNADFIGGPVVNLQGLIVGMVINGNGQILPAEAIDGAIKTYLQSGKVIRPVIGIKYLMLTTTMAKLRGLPTASAQVSEVSIGSAAAKAGLLAGDLITEVDGRQLSDSSFEQLVVSHGPSTMELTVRRGQQTLKLNITPEMK